ncbi:MAG: glycosyltransferase family 2 protein [Panacagrimonas sp.]
MSFPLCSVIVPVYRHETLLAECLKSVLVQSWPRIELIVIDDASPDASFDRARELTGSPEYRQRFERIVCERNETNKGAHASFNRGMALAQGEYLFLLNSDDRYHPLRLGRMVAEMADRGSRFAFSGIHPFADGDTPIPESLLGLIAYLDGYAPQLPSLSFAFLRINATVTTGNFAMTRELAQQVGPFIDLKLAHDYDWALRAIAFEEPLYVPERLYDYRLHPTNTFASVAHRARLETEVCFTRYLKMVVEGPVPNKLAPCPLNWPLVFEHYIKLWNLDHLWSRLAHGEAIGGRTRDKTRRRPQAGLHAGAPVRGRP